MTEPPAPAPRLAVCGNLFPTRTLGSVLTALEGPIAAWSRRLGELGLVDRLGFGLYLPASLAEELHRDDDRAARLAKTALDAGVAIWTANAFPFGDFHSSRVKERAFLPDWRSPERYRYTSHIADLLAHMMMPGETGSLSTCPLGYGPAAGEGTDAADHLRRMQEELLQLEESRGVRLTLALEPEPDGCFERVVPLTAWLADTVHAGVKPADRRIGVCWDLCHSAVVGEEPTAVTSALEQTGTPLGKVQISRALAVPGPLTIDACDALADFSNDPYLHQVRGRAEEGDFACPDLPDFLADPPPGASDLRVHCHVPVHHSSFGNGLIGTDWRASLAEALRFGCRDFELETYTLGVLPSSARGGQSAEALLLAETAACVEALGLTTVGNLDIGPIEP